jgi:hypothetical protein
MDQCASFQAAADSAITMYMNSTFPPSKTKPSGTSTTTASSVPSRGFTTDDKIALGIGIPSMLFAMLGIVLAWQQHRSSLRRSQSWQEANILPAGLSLNGGIIQNSGASRMVDPYTVRAQTF